jgi:spore coat protein CotH
MNRTALFYTLIVLVGSACSDTTTGGNKDVSVDSSNVAPEVVTTGVLAINEIVAAGGEGSDWFEVIVLGDTPVDLSRFTVVDDSSKHEQAALGTTVLEPGEFYVVKALSDDETSDDPYVPFKLGSDDSLTLFEDGVAIDTLDWADGEAPEGTSYGRLPDGTGEAQMLSPTPGAANEALENYTPPCTDPFDPSRVAKVEFEFTGNGWKAIQDNPAAEEFQEAAFIFDGERVEKVAIRTKGNSSLNSSANSNTTRFPFKVDFNEYVDGQAFCGIKKLAFNTGFKDPSLMREHIAYKLGAEVGLYSPRTMYADLWVNGEHVGLYLMVEPVDDDFFIEKHFANDDGDLYKPDWPAGHLMDQGNTLEDYPGVEIENNQETSDHSKLMKLIQVTNHGPNEELDSVLNVEMMLRYAAFNALLVNLDSYTGNGHNYYIYEQESVFTIIPWDLNEAFGNFTCGCNTNAILSFLIDEPTCGSLAEKPLLDAALQTASNQSRYHELLQEMLDGPFNVATMAPWINETADLIRPYVEADPTKLYSTSDFEASLNSDVKGAQGLTSFIEKRSAAVQEQLSGSAPSTNNGEGNCGNGNGNGPGGGGGGGGNPKCPDGICDAFEQANPHVCPEDCE